MSHEKSTYQKAAEAHEAVEAAEKRVIEAREALYNAEDVYQAALFEFESLMIQGEREDTLELRQSAFRQHEQVLLRELNQAVAAKDYTQIAILGNKLAKVKENDKNITEAIWQGKRPEEFIYTMRNFFLRHRITDEDDRTHYEKRAWRLYSLFGDIPDPDERLFSVMISLEKEFDDFKKQKLRMQIG